MRTRGARRRRSVYLLCTRTQKAGQREDAWKRMFAGAETVESIPDFDDCERYRRLKRDGLLKTLGKPIRKDANRERKEKSDQNATSKKRKVCEECTSLEGEKMVLLAQYQSQKTINHKLQQVNQKLEQENEELRKRLRESQRDNQTGANQTGANQIKVNLVYKYKC
jgi:hypothetical protein